MNLKIVTCSGDREERVEFEGNDISRINTENVDAGYIYEKDGIIHLCLYPPKKVTVISTFLKELGNCVFIR